MTTPIRGRDTLTAQDALQAILRHSPNRLRMGDVSLYCAEVVALCGAFNLRASVLLAQACHETAGFSSFHWSMGLNVAGIGIDGPSATTPYTILDGAEAAALHVWSMLIALREWSSAERIILPPAANGWKQRWSTKYRGPECPVVQNVEDLNLIYSGNRATWAADPQYATKVLAVMARLFPAQAGESEEPVSVTFGRVPHPAFHNRPIFKPEGKGQNNLGKRSVKGVVWHRMLGSLNGTDGYFRNPSVGALTDYGIGVTGTDGKALNGVIYRWNDPYGYQSGWASGPLSAPYGDGLAFYNKYGLNAVNRDQVSIEISGQYGTALTPESRQAVAALTAYFADQYGIPWDQFPIAPQDGFSFVRWHQEFTGTAEKPCPGTVVIRETNDLIELTRQIMRQYQEQPGTQPETPDGSIYATPITYPWLVREVADEGIDRAIGRTPVYYFPGVYTCIEETPRNQDAGAKSKEIGPPIKVGTKFAADYVFRSRGVAYVLTPYGTRVRAAALLPKIQVTTRGTISVRRTPEGKPEIGRSHAVE